MNIETLNKLRELAEKADQHEWGYDPAATGGVDAIVSDSGAVIIEQSYTLGYDPDLAFMAAMSPPVALKLIALASQSLVAHTDAGGVVDRPAASGDVRELLARAYPLVDSPHASVNNRIAMQREAFTKGYQAASAERAPVVGLTHEQIKAAGGIVHKDGNIFFTNIDKLNACLASANGEQK